jgi:rubrerythrin
MKLDEMIEDIQRRLTPPANNDIKESYRIRLRDLKNIIEKYTFNITDYTEFYELLLIESGATMPTVKQAFTIIKEIKNRTNPTIEKPRLWTRCLNCKYGYNLNGNEAEICPVCGGHYKNYLEEVPAWFEVDDDGECYEPATDETWELCMNELKGLSKAKDMDRHI